MSEIFKRVVCGVDASEAGEAAAQLAARVTEPSGQLVLITVEDPSIAVHAGWAASHVMEELAVEARQALERATAVAAPVHQIETRLLEGNPLDCLRAEIDRGGATLVVVGSHGQSRAVGIALGSVATHLLHEVPCSVLIARKPRAERWPRTIVVGVDGSAESAEAAAVARALADRFGSRLRFVTALHEPNLDREAAHRIAPELVEVRGRAVAELDVLSESADLVVVGSRGLKGIRALGSVSERIAHEARSCVLVVRGKHTVEAD